VERFTTQKENFDHGRKYGNINHRSYVKRKFWYNQNLEVSFYGGCSDLCYHFPEQKLIQSCLSRVMNGLKNHHKQWACLG
jgi:hypothetical protein